MLWPKPAKRDKPWKYIPLEFQRYTKLSLATGNLYEHVENTWGIPFPKRIEWKYCFLNELFREQVSDHKLTTKFKWVSASNYQMIYFIGQRWLQIKIYKLTYNYKLTTSDHKLIDNHKQTISLVDYKMTASNNKWPQAGWVQINYKLDTMTTSINISWNWLIDWAH